MMSFYKRQQNSYSLSFSFFQSIFSLRDTIHQGADSLEVLLTAGAIVLLLLAFDLKTVQKALPFNFTIVTAIGLLLSFGTAAGSIFFNVPFFTHAFDYFTLPLFGKTSLHTAMIFDAGVYLVVVGAAVTMIQTIGGDE